LLNEVLKGDVAALAPVRSAERDAKRLSFSFNEIVFSAFLTRMIWMRRPTVEVVGRRGARPAIKAWLGYSVGWANNSHPYGLFTSVLGVVKFSGNIANMMLILMASFLTGPVLASSSDPHSSPKSKEIYCTSLTRGLLMMWSNISTSRCS
jgi:hypothetical protein